MVKDCVDPLFLIEELPNNRSQTKSGCSETGYFPHYACIDFPYQRVHTYNSTSKFQSSGTIQTLVNAIHSLFKFIQVYSSFPIQIGETNLTCKHFRKFELFKKLKHFKKLKSFRHSYMI